MQTASDVIYEKAYRKGRADTIAEFLKKDKDCGKTLDECPNLYTEISCVECIAGKIDDKKNESRC